MTDERTLIDHVASLLSVHKRPREIRRVDRAAPQRDGQGAEAAAAGLTGGSFVRWRSKSGCARRSVVGGVSAEPFGELVESALLVGSTASRARSRRSCRAARRARPVRRRRRATGPTGRGRPGARDDRVARPGLRSWCRPTGVASGDDRLGARPGQGQAWGSRASCVARPKLRAARAAVARMHAEEDQSVAVAGSRRVCRTCRPTIDGTDHPAGDVEEEPGGGVLGEEHQ